MAYLRGKSYVDGDLTVEGALQVKRLTTVSGNAIPYLENGSLSSLPNYLVQFISSDGGISYAPIELANNGSLLKFKNSSLSLSLLDKKTSESTSVIMACSISDSSIPTLVVGDSADYSSVVKITADKIKIQDYGLKLINSKDGDYWVYDV